MRTMIEAEGVAGRPRPPELAPALASFVVTLVCSGLGVCVLIAVATGSGPAAVAIGAVLVAAMVAIQLGYVSRPGCVHTAWRTALALLGQAALVLVPAAAFGSRWFGMAALLVASLLITCPLALSIPSSLAVVGASTTLGILFDPEPTGPYALVSLIIAVLLGGLGLFGLTRLAHLVVVLTEARDELSRTAVAEERLRFARDTHDVLGMSLSAITLKAELGSRLIAQDPERAGREIAEVLAVARRAVTEVRMIASGRSVLSLPEELASARNVLGAATIEVVVEDLSSPDWPDTVITLLATAVRESVTNVLRHTQAVNVTIRAEPVGSNACLTITNDGATLEDRESGPLGGHGLHNLSMRAEELGGRMSAELRDGVERFVLTIEVPLDGMAPVR